MAKINNNQFVGLAEYWNSVQTDPITPTGTPLNLYEFEIVSGFINITERGESNLKTITERETTSIMLQTNNEPMVVYWVDSFKATLNKTQVISDNGTIYPAEQSSTKNFQIGKYYKAHLVGDPSVSFDTGNVDINGDIYNTLEKNINVTLYVDGIDFNTTNFNKKLFLILDPRVKAYQWLKINNCTPVYKPNIEKIKTEDGLQEEIREEGLQVVGSYIQLTNLNLLFSTNGRDILSFIQLTHPGGNYAFPKEDLNGDVSLDIKHLQLVRGVRNIQLEADSGLGINSITIYGRQRDNKYITTPKRLLLYTPKLPQLSALDFTPSGINNYYIFWNCKNIMEGYWNSWKEKVESLYNYDNQKKFRGGLEVNFEEARESNEQLNGFYTGNCFSNQWTFPIMPITKVNYNLKENYLTTNEWDFHNISKKIDLADFLNFNGFIYQTVEELPTDYKETIKWSLKSIPVIGTTLSLITKPFRVIMGFDPGWTTSNTWIASKPINLAIPTTTAEMADTIMGKTSLVPYEVFTNDNSNFTAAGNKLLNTCLHFSLTDRFQSDDSALIIPDALEGKGGNGIWDTKYLGQTVDENGNSLGIPNTEPFYGKLLFTPNCRKIAPLDPMQTYEIDFINYKVYGSADMRLSFFSNDSLNNEDTRHVSVYETRHQNVAKYKDDATLWSNSFVLNFMTEFNSDNAFVYPDSGEPPSPEEKIEISEVRGKQIKFSYQEYEDGKEQISALVTTIPNRETGNTNNLFLNKIDKDEYPNSFKLGQDLGNIGFYFWDPSGNNTFGEVKSLFPNNYYQITDWIEISLPAGTEIDDTFRIQTDLKFQHNKVEQNNFYSACYSENLKYISSEDLYEGEFNLYDFIPDMGVFTNTWVIGYPESFGNNNWLATNTTPSENKIVSFNQNAGAEDFILWMNKNFSVDGYLQYPNIYYFRRNTRNKFNSVINIALLMDIINPKIKIKFKKINGKWKLSIYGSGMQRFGLLNFPFLNYYDVEFYPYEIYEFHSIRNLEDVKNKDTTWKDTGLGEWLKHNIEVNSEGFINSMILIKKNN